MNDELQHLKNLGKTSAQWLHAAGIHSASDLRRWVRWVPTRPSRLEGSAPPRCCCTPLRAPCWTCTGTICRSNAKKRSINNWTRKILRKKIQNNRGEGIDA